jgi:hypothetical protein
MFRFRIWFIRNKMLSSTILYVRQDLDHFQMLPGGNGWGRDASAVFYYFPFILTPPVLRIRDPVLFLTPGSGFGIRDGKKSGSGMNIPDHFSESF